MAPTAPVYPHLPEYSRSTNSLSELLFHSEEAIKQFKIKPSLGFLGGTVVKNPPANAGDTGSSPGLGRSHMLQSN